MDFNLLVLSLLLQKIISNIICMYVIFVSLTVNLTNTIGVFNILFLL